MKRHTVTIAAFASLSVIAQACSTGSGATANASGPTPSVAAAPAQEGWRTLIDPSMSAWRGYKEEGMPAGWKVTDGVLSKVQSTNDLVTRDEFGDFELVFDWKLHPGGNAGVFYRGNEDFEKIYFTAPEYQLLDDAGHPDGKSRLTSAGSDYALYPSPAGIVKPADQWNSSRIIARGPHVEHWLNGQKLLQYEAGSPDWETRLKASKFATWPKYGRLTKGRIGIQGDHAGELAIRNMRIRILP
jgi:hypothetical protein